MKKLVINGGVPLKGEIEICGMKNSALPILFATIVTSGVSVIGNLPRVGDIETTLEILSAMGAGVRWLDGGTVEIDTTGVRQGTSPDALVRRLRGSNYLLGAELARFGRARVGVSGGCNFGPRPIDLHIKGFCALGAAEEDSSGSVCLHAGGGLHGARIVMDNISVGATANIMIAASTADGLTVIENAAQEPHIVDLACYLNTCGAHVTGAGTPKIKIRGVEKLHGGTHTIVSDMIEAGTYMIAAAATGGEVTLRNVVTRHLEALTLKLLDMGVWVEDAQDSITVRRGKPLHSANIQSMPYPGFPTDLQPQMTALLTLAEGIGTVKENVFPKRFRYVEELRRMGAAVNVDEAASTATVIGVRSLHGAAVEAPDLRAGAALVIAALAAEGESTVRGAELIERGYADLVGKLTSLGAHIRSEEDGMA